MEPKVDYYLLTYRTFIGVAKGTYDKIFDFQNDQPEVYNFIEPSISKVTDGFN